MLSALLLTTLVYYNQASEATDVNSMKYRIELTESTPRFITENVQYFDVINTGFIPVNVGYSYKTYNETGDIFRITMKGTFSFYLTTKGESLGDTQQVNWKVCGTNSTEQPVSMNMVDVTSQLEAVDDKSYNVYFTVKDAVFDAVANRPFSFRCYDKNESILLMQTHEFRMELMDPEVRCPPAETIAVMRMALNAFNAHAISHAPRPVRMQSFAEAAVQTDHDEVHLDSENVTASNANSTSDLLYQLISHRRVPVLNGTGGSRKNTSSQSGSVFGGLAVGMLVFVVVGAVIFGSIKMSERLSSSSA